MPVSKKRKDIKHLSKTGRCKTIKGKQLQNGCYHVSTNFKSNKMPLIPVGKAGRFVMAAFKKFIIAKQKEKKLAKTI